jgi:hypothetical protein
MVKSTLSIILIIIAVCCTSCTSRTAQEASDSTTASIYELLQKAKIQKGSPALSTLKRIDSIRTILPQLPDSLLTQTLFRKGIAYRQLGKLDSAAIYFHQAVSKDKEHTIHDKTIAYYRNKWEMDLEKGDASNAISTANSLVNRAQKEENNKALYFAYNALGLIYQRIKDIPASLKHSEKASQAAREGNDTINEVIEAAQRSFLLASIGKLEEAQNLINPYVNKHKGYPDIANSELFLNYGTVQYFTGDYRTAIESYKKSMDYSRKLEVSPSRNHNISTAYVNIGESYRELTNKPLEIANIDSAMVYARTSGSLDAIRYASRQQIMAKYEGRSNINELIQDFDQLVVSQYDDYKLKIEREQKDLALANENEIKLIQDKTTAEIKAIQSRDRSIIIAIVTGILLLLAYILYQRRIFKFARQKLLIQQRLLRSQMNPHFTFNVLSTIQNQIKPNPQEAENYLVKFSRLLRLILENSTKDYILLEKEIESLNKYVQLQQIRFPNLFDFKIEYLDMEEDEFLFIPPMLLQPFVENSIEHGFDGVDYRAEIRITLSRKQNYLHCTIEDNGKGFKDSNVNEKSSLSTNLISTYLKDATKSKIDVINKRDSDTEKSGLITRFLIPYKTTDA